MAAIYEYWIQQIGFDAFRVDTALEVDQGCWQTFCPAIHTYAANNAGNTNFFMFAEADNGNDSIVGAYTGTKDGGPFEYDSTVDYPLYYAMKSVFAHASGYTAQIQNHYNAVVTDYDPAARMQLVTFLDNHDNDRFLSTSEANNHTNQLEAALVFLYSSPGIPCLYYGTEQGFDGTTDPDDREDMFAGEFKDGPGGTVQQLSSPGVDNFNMTHPLFLWVAQLNNFRRLYPALMLGTYTNQANNASGPGLFAYTRSLNSQEILVALNSDGSTQTLAACQMTYPAGTALVNLLNTNETVTLDGSGKTSGISVPAISGKMFIALSQWQPLDPVVVSNSPAHWAANVQVASPIVLQFSQGMDVNSVQSAFHTIPPVSGSFAWSSQSAANDTVTFTPAPPFFAGSTNVTVIVSNTALAAATGKTLFASYALAFNTAPSPGTVYFASPATNGTIVPMATNTTYLIQVCFTPTLDTNDASLFQLTINGALQPQSAYIFRPVGSVAGCPGMRSLLYNWSGGAPGTNLIEVVYTSQGIVLGDSRTVIVPPPLMISAVNPGTEQVIWSSTPGVNYIVLSTTNLTQPFTPASGTITANSLSTTFLDVSNSPPAPQKFYEIEQVP